MLEEKLPRGRLPIELTALMSWAVEGNVCLACRTPSGRRRRAATVSSRTSQAGDDLFGIERGGLLSQINVTVDLASERQGRRGRRCGANLRAPIAAFESRCREPNAPVYVRARGDRRRPMRCRHPPRHLQIRPARNCRRLRLRNSRRQYDREAALVCRSLRSTIATTLSSLWKGIGVVGALTSRGIIGLAPYAMQSTR